MEITTEQLHDLAEHLTVYSGLAAEALATIGVTVAPSERSTTVTEQERDAVALAIREASTGALMATIPAGRYADAAIKALGMRVQP